MVLSNYHSHCTFCDGRSVPEDFLKEAIRQGFRAYGFSSHAPLPFETFWNMSAKDMPAYLAEIDRLKKEYGDRIEVYTGLEIDFLDDAYNPSIDYFRQLPLDYRIGSVHFIPQSEVQTEENMLCIDGPYEEFAAAVDHFYNGDIRRLTEEYYRSVCRMVELGGLDIVGHVDKIYQNGHRYPGFSLEADWYKDLFYACIELIAQKGLMVELNTKNYHRKQQLFPHSQFLALLREKKIPMMVNSDTHFPHLVNDGREEALALLKEAGFTHTRELIQGRWEDRPL
ncbi:histidinol-phosphatase (PHP family) [Parabacteroides sp. PFB2-12]|uniref:histidinol-phosphatase n=1 Tax=unclassified Parabacteroides TaxID=2649774 RepID=UPI002474BCDE|nr:MULTISPECIES: histidinol-phosphatase [unclassified Parabacteroides]MDH6344190.1 histidinol-phosphatase (PHP family) [Parabacteroides sp. PM6-13]MDH6392097.1 histidinol-phosphatase (PHP family) [Parabacteroides sp. PFB2-12]